MKIGIDTFGCDPKSGLGSYLIYFIANLPHSEEYTFELFGPEIDRYTYTSDNDINFISVNIRDSVRVQLRWHRRRIKKFIRKNGYDIVLFPAAENVLPKRFRKYKGVAILNSIVSSSFANATGRKKRQIKKGLNRIQKIVAASDIIKQDLVNLGIESEKIKVIANGIDHKSFYPMSELLEDDIVDVKPFAIKRPYFIYGSRLSGPDKKHIELIRAFNLFKKNTGLPHRLVLAGNDGDNADLIHEEAYNSEFASDIFLTGYFPHENFPKLNAGADACVFPSVNEGSGLSVIEAMACGVPVICSDKGALKEVAGDVPLYFNSDEPEDIAAKMQEIVENETLREQKVEEGLKRTANYNWETTVSKTLEFALK